ncbi:hypothetical protein [Ascidiaceihabitans sp.]|uniref:hypothetical protein n=1 Tax=Ascidiaceihabitans sp. TaxID=1872644 RepID=UPI00329A28D1
MIPKLILIAGALGALAACQPAVPDSGAQPGVPGRGVGFDTSTQAKQQVTQQQVPAAAPVQSSALPTAGAAPAPAPRPAADPVIATAESALNNSSPATAAANANDVENARAASLNSGAGVVNASPANAAPTLVNNPGISDENDFGAVSSRQSIESDKARIAANRAQYTVVQPTALPSREGGNQPNVVAYALQNKHPKGTQLYRRLGFNAANKFEKNCAVYRSADEAQIDFLARGGPEKDRKGLDPDGDGYACRWDPTPYRAASGG